MRRSKRLNPYRPATDLGLVKIFAILVMFILIVATGSIDCRFHFINIGFC